MDTRIHLPKPHCQLHVCPSNLTLLFSPRGAPQTSVPVGKALCARTSQPPGAQLWGSQPYLCPRGCAVPCCRPCRAVAMPCCGHAGPFSQPHSAQCWAQAQLAQLPAWPQPQQEPRFWQEVSTESATAFRNREHYRRPQLHLHRASLFKISWSNK